MNENNYLSGSAQHPHDGQPRVILGDDGDNNIYDNATGSVLVGNLGNDYIFQLELTGYLVVQVMII